MNTINYYCCFRQNMVKTLEDICLACVARHVANINRLGSQLSRRHKEVLIQRMCCHNLFTPDLLPSISYHLFSDVLQRVNFSHSQQVDDRTLEVLATCGCHPNSLTIHNCQKVTDKGIQVLAKVNLLWKLEYLEISRMKSITGQGLCALKSRSLNELSLTGCCNILDSGVIAVVRNCPNITKLDLSELHKLTDESIVAVAEVLADKLEELNCEEISQLTSQSTEALARHCHRLQVVLFEGCVKLDGTGLLQMAENCSLRVLNISFCYKISSDSLDVLISTLKAKECLTSINMMGVSLRGLGMEFLSTCSSLTHLSLSGVRELDDNNLEMICKERGSSLLELDISSCPSLTEKACTFIAKYLTALESLGMRNLRDVTGMSLHPLFKGKRGKEIRSVTLSGSKNLSSVIVEAIAIGCPNLTRLQLAGLQNITDDIALAIAHHCPAMSHVSFRSCHLTDVGVCELAIRCNKLVIVGLAGNHSLTDKSIICLAENCHYIEEVYLSGCARITKAAIAYLQDTALNSVLVKHATPNAPDGLLMAKDLDTGEYTRMDDKTLKNVM